MYARRIKGRNQIWGSLFQSSKYLFRPNCLVHACARSLSHTAALTNPSPRSHRIGRYLLESFLSSAVAPGNCHTGFHVRSSIGLRSTQLRAYSSEGDGRNASENNQKPVTDGANLDKGEKGKTWPEKVSEDVKHCDAHARLGEQEQKEWLHNEKLTIENKKKESPFLTRRERFKNEFSRRVVPWEKINISWETFPYHIHEYTKNLLVECVASHLKHKKFAASFGGRLSSSSGRILLRSVPGTELYRERLVRALAQDLRVPLLVLDSNILAPYDFGDDYSSDEDNVESCEDCTSESEIEDENDTSNEDDCTSNNEAKSDCSDADADAEVTAEKALKKLVPYNLEDFEKTFAGEVETSSESPKSDGGEASDRLKQPLKKGDRVKYTGPSMRIEADDRN